MNLITVHRETNKVMDIYDEVQWIEEPEDDVLRFYSFNWGICVFRGLHHPYYLTEIDYDIGTILTEEEVESLKTNRLKEEYMDRAL